MITASKISFYVHKDTWILFEHIILELWTCLLNPNETTDFVWAVICYPD